MEILNLDALKVRTVAIQKGDRTYELRDDPPFDFGIDVLSLRENLRAVQDAKALAEMKAAMEELREETLAVFTKLIRHSLPEETAESLAQVFEFDEQMRVIELFFLRRSNASQPPVNDSSDAEETSETGARKPRQTARKNPTSRGKR